MQLLSVLGTEPLRVLRDATTVGGGHNSWLAATMHDCAASMAPIGSAELRLGSVILVVAAFRIVVRLGCRINGRLLTSFHFDLKLIDFTKSN